MRARDLNFILRQVSDRIRGVLRRGIVRMVHPAAAGGQQHLQLDFGLGNVSDGVPLLLPYGLHTVPRVGAEAMVYWPGGARGRGWVLIADDRAGRPSWESGEMGLYHPDAGTHVRLRSDGVVEIMGEARVVGDLEVTGDVRDAAGTMAEMRQIFNLHTHTTPSGQSGTPVPQMGVGA